MAFSSTSQVLHDGNRNVVMQFTGISDGVGQEANIVKVDVSALNPPADSVSVRKITYDVSGGILRLLWSDTEPVPFLDLSAQNSISYKKIGGMVNGGSDTSNGDILFSTLGFEAGSSYSITLEMTKKFP